MAEDQGSKSLVLATITVVARHWGECTYSQTNPQHFPHTHTTRCSSPPSRLPPASARWTQTATRLGSASTTLTCPLRSSVMPPAPRPATSTPGSTPPRGRGPARPYTATRKVARTRTAITTLNGTAACPFATVTLGTAPELTTASRVPSLLRAARDPVRAYRPLTATVDFLAPNKQTTLSPHTVATSALRTPAADATGTPTRAHVRSQRLRRQQLRHLRLGRVQLHVRLRLEQARRGTH